MRSALIVCPPIGKHSLMRNDESRILIIDNTLIKFTPTEYRLLLCLLHGRPVADLDLIQEVFSCVINNTAYHNISKHVDKIRLKIRSSGLTICRINKYGYVLLSDVS